jgi:hypothetical protein
MIGAVPTGLRDIFLFAYPTLKGGASIHCAYGAGLEAGSRLSDCTNREKRRRSLDSSLRRLARDDRVL